MDLIPLNWKLISHPINWVVIVLMLLIVGFGLHIALPALGVPSKSTASN